MNDIAHFGQPSLLGALPALIPVQHVPEDHPEAHPWRWDVDITPENAHLLVDFLEDVETAAEADLCAAADRAALRALVGPS